MVLDDTSTDTPILPVLPFLVVINIAPDFPRKPYNAEAVAPFNTDIDSMSSAAISFNFLLA